MYEWNGIVDKCNVINKDYIFQGATVKMYQWGILQATWTLSVHIQNDGTQTYTDFECDKVLMLPYLTPQQDCLRFNITLCGFWNTLNLFNHFHNIVFGHIF